MSINDRLREASVYYLILELLEDGQAGLISGSDAIPEASLILELRRRTGKDFGAAKESWVRYFIQSNDLGSELERANLMMFVRTQEAMRRIWDRVKDR